MSLHDLPDGSDASEVLLREIEDMLNIGGWQLDVSSGTVIWSDKVYDIHGVPRGTPTRTIDAIEFYAPHERPRISALVASCAEQGVAYDAEFEFINAHGEALWIRTTGEAVRDESGKIVRLRGTFQDITGRKQTERERASAVAERDLFKQVIDASHDLIGISDTELRLLYLNPAGRAMIGMAQDADVSDITIADCYPERLRHAFMDEAFATNGAGTPYTGEMFLRHLVTNEEIPVLDTHFPIRDPDTGELIAFATITRDVSQLAELRQTVERERLRVAEAAKQEHHITFESASQPAFCACDEVQIGQVFINLLGNAIDATAHLDERWSRVSLSFAEGFYYVQVEDSGPGIDAAVVADMFTPFFATTDVGVGTGLA